MHQSRASMSGFTLLLLAASAFAAPTPQEDFYKLSRVPSGKYKQSPGVVALERTYTKYHWELPPGLPVAAEAARKKIIDQQKNTDASSPPAYNKAIVKGQVKTVGSITVVPQPYNAEYLAPVTVGGQRLQMDIDTGSSDLWVFNTNLDSKERGSHNIYDPKKSKTYVNQPGESFKISYGDGTSLDGNVALDRVQIGGIAVDNQKVELPSTVSVGLTNDASDGILGLGFQSINSIYEKGQASPQPTWFENALPRLAQPVFTANLRTGTSGRFVFGEIDHTAYKEGTLKYVPVDSSAGYWGFPSANYAIGKEGQIQTNNGANQGIVDTGSSLFYIDEAPFRLYWSHVKGSNKDDETGLTTFPCGTELPDFRMSIGNEMVSIPGHLLNWKPDEDDNGRCVGGIQSNGGSGPQVYGDILFQVYYFIFDYGGKRLGFAPHA